MKWKLKQQEKKLDSLFELVNNVTNEEQKAYLAKFLCVRTSGYIESAIRNLINEFADKTTPKPIQSYVNKEVKYITNLKFDKLSNLLNSFDEDWKIEFEDKVNDAQKSAINSIVSNRNNIAHGENDSITYGSMKDYYTHCKEVVEILKSIIKK